MRTHVQNRERMRRFPPASYIYRYIYQPTNATTTTVETLENRPGYDLHWPAMLSRELQTIRAMQGALENTMLA